MERLKLLFGRNKPSSVSQNKVRPLPSDPDFDIHAWLREGKEIEEKYPDSPGVQEMRAIGLGFSDFVTLEQKVEQQRRWDELQREEGKQGTATPNRRAS